MNYQTWVYQMTEPGVFTVGFFTPDGQWKTDSDHKSREKAAERVRYLNGGCGCACPNAPSV